MKRQIQFSVNGSNRTIQVEPHETLLEVLRSQLGLTGAKLGCDQQVCGACTVLMGGLPVSSCSVLALDADNSQVTTIEGLGAGDSLDPIQKAFLEHGAFQCAYCTPGMILAVTALRNQIPDPTDEQIRHFLAGNICRCGCHVEIMAAARSVTSAVK